MKRKKMERLVVAACCNRLKCIFALLGACVDARQDAVYRSHLMKHSPYLSYLTLPSHLHGPVFSRSRRHNALLPLFLILSNLSFHLKHSQPLSSLSTTRMNSSQTFENVLFRWKPECTETCREPPMCRFFQGTWVGTPDSSAELRLSEWQHWFITWFCDLRLQQPAP